MQVLISDDHMAITMVACQLAKQAFDDPTVRVAHGVDALFDELNQHPVDLLVLDLTMPGTVKRIELLRAVRRWSPTPRILTNSTDASPCVIAAALKCGLSRGRSSGVQAVIEARCRSQLRWKPSSVGAQPCTRGCPACACTAPLPDHGVVDGPGPTATFSRKRGRTNVQ